MPLSYYPRAGAILICDLSDFSPPEMDKIRPVIVVSPRLPHRSQIAAIVPLSTTAPNHSLPFCVKLSKNYHPMEPDQPSTWAKCDMIMNIAIERLNGFKVGRRQWEHPIASKEDLEAVRQGILHGLGFGNLIST
jgi:uncharacterized protein YifN (PemK superfamily)